ncbi:hypothetical protein GCM10012279_09860 [Micromonospora yangpuensis]|nr:hypothetical protein GCM10012279_09860 [Micromonospora yangpuensis]
MTIYQHFSGREAIVAAVAVDGFAELARSLTEARTPAEPPAGSEPPPAPSCPPAGPEPSAEPPPAVERDGPVVAWSRVVQRYLDFAYAHPQVYDAMFLLTAELPFGVPEGPPALHAVFAELRSALTPLAAGRDPEALAEVGWSVLHGMVMLTRGGRLRPDRQDQRETLIMAGLFGTPPPARPETGVPSPPSVPYPRQPEPTTGEDA